VEGHDLGQASRLAAATGAYVCFEDEAGQTLRPPKANTHISAAMRRFIEAHPDWLTEARLPACALDLNPVEGAWANMKNGLGNLATRDVDQLTAIIKNRLKSIQYRPALIDGFLPRPGSPSNQNRRRPQPFNLCRDRPGPSWSEVWEPLQPTGAERRMDPWVVAATEKEVVVHWHQHAVSRAGSASTVRCSASTRYETQSSLARRCSISTPSPCSASSPRPGPELVTSLARRPSPSEAARSAAIYETGHQHTGPPPT